MGGKGKREWLPGIRGRKPKRFLTLNKYHEDLREILKLRPEVKVILEVDRRVDLRKSLEILGREDLFWGKVDRFKNPEDPQVLELHRQWREQSENG